MALFVSDLGTLLIWASSSFFPAGALSGFRLSWAGFPFDVLAGVACRFCVRCVLVSVRVGCLGMAVADRIYRLIRFGGLLFS